MYTPRLNTRRWFGSHNAPATRPDNERQGAAYAPVVQLHDEIDRLFDGMFRGMMNPWDFDFMPRLTSSGAGGSGAGGSSPNSMTGSGVAMFSSISRSMACWIWSMMALSGSFGTAGEWETGGTGGTSGAGWGAAAGAGEAFGEAEPSFFFSVQPPNSLRMSSME